MSEPIVELHHVAFGYNGEPVLHDADLRIETPGLVTVVGPNGGGKTTLLRLLTGLLRPDRGTIRVLGDVPWKPRVRRRIGYVPQSLEWDRRFPATTLDVVLMGRIGLGGWRHRRADRERAREALATVGLTDAVSAPFGELSGGMRQRALIARALCAEPALLLLDEATAHVDPRTEAELFDLLHTLSDSMTVIVVSHDLGMVTSEVPHVVCVNRTVAVHPTERLTDDLVREIYGGEVLMVRHDHVCDDLDHEHG